MSRLTTHIIAIILCCISSQGQAQMLMNGNELWLSTGQKTLPEEHFLSYESSELVNGKFYRYLQFYKLPGPGEKQLLTNAGVELLDYIPNNTYIAAIPAHLNLALLDARNIRAVSIILPEERIAADFDRSESGQQQFIIQFQKNINEDQALCFLEGHQIEITSPYFQNNSIRISASAAIIERLATAPLLLFIEQVSEIALESHYGNAQHRSNTLSTNFPNGRHFDGTGVNIAIGDDGFVGPHIDFSGRISEDNTPTTSQSQHADMVAGILSGAGNLHPNIEGIAKGSNLFIFNGFEAVEKASFLYQTKDVVITSTSFGDGCNRGYTTFAQLADLQTYENPSLIHVFSAGNAGEQDCAYGAGAGWGNITGGVKVGKNVLAVGNIDSNNDLVYNSSRGPSNDGRIKPDICANGEGRISTAPDHSFQVSSGSSAAAPVISGILAQLYQAFRSLNNNQNPESALMKALLLNTADDLGNPGPDYSYGWGKANALRAIQSLEAGHYFQDSVNQNQSLSFDLNVPEDVQNLKVMLYWNDKEGSTVSVKSLVNDIDFHIQKDSSLYIPWRPDPTPNPLLLNQPATSGADHVNNVEQIVVDNPVSGSYDIIVNGFNIPHSPQKFYIVYCFTTSYLTLTYPFGNEKLNQEDSIRIHWDADAGSGDENFELEFSQNNGQSWTPIATVDDHVRYYDWVLPEIITAEALIRITRNGLSTVNEVPFYIYDAPTGLEVSQVCPDYVSLEWNASVNAVKYTIYSLEDKYMDSIASTGNTYIDLPITNPEEVHWFAVAAVHENGTQSQRTMAINDGEGLMDCTIQNDISLLSLSLPETHIIQSCFDQDLQISINIKNEGTVFQSGFKLYYQYDNLSPVAENYPGVVPPGITVNYNFQSSPPMGQTGEHLLKVWTASEEDQASYNDSLSFSLMVNSSVMVSIPYFQNFDDFQNCLQADNQCGSNCHLHQGWTNAKNEIGDAIDWRINKGATSTPGTGPQRDQNSNNELGKYLYLEGSPGCFNQAAILYSPCIDLGNSTEPLLSFWYHMFGSDMGNLHIDLFDGTTWYNNILIPFYGDQGADWQKAEIDLSSFSGNIINIRFRAYTGGGFLTDLAIDNFSVVETAAPPIADFILEKHLVCTDESILLFDNSYNEPLAWEWSIEPSSFSFVNGTSLGSPNPQISFGATGSYSISLKTTNNFGNDEHIKQDVIVVSDGLEIPYTENFNDTPIPSLDWRIENIDLNKTWEDILILGKSGQETNAVYVNNHSYNATGQEDILESKVIDLTTAQNPYLRFDFSYAPFNQNFSDRLRLELSTDCKNSFTEVLFNKGGQALATAPNQMTGWTPHSAENWKTEIIDLSPYAGLKVAVRFVNICGFGNNLYLDNIALYEQEDFPRPDFNFEPDVQQYCTGENIVFENLSEGLNLQSFEWTFGAFANPESANTEGPHTVTFNTPGVYNISLKAFNSIGWEEEIKTIEIIDVPIADFSFSIDGATVAFNNESDFGSTYFWSFGDNTTSTLENPVHTFSHSTSYNVILLVKNRCGESAIEQTFLITSLSEPNQSFFYNIQPNPADDYFKVNGFSSRSSDFEYSLFDISGKSIFQRIVKNQSGKFSEAFKIDHLPSGVYLLKIQADQQSITQRIVVF